jgi:hypothetical protein
VNLSYCNSPSRTPHLQYTFRADGQEEQVQELTLRGADGSFVVDSLLLRVFLHGLENWVGFDKERVVVRVWAGPALSGIYYFGGEILRARFD